MTVRASACFSDPSEIPVTIELTGSLKEFEELYTYLMRKDEPVPFWVVRNLVEQISDASHKLRRTTQAREPARRAACAADFGFIFHEERRK